MSSHNEKSNLPPLDLSGWRWLPTFFMVVGGFLTLIGALLSWKYNDLKEFGTSWLLAFMFYYSIALGALFMVMMHHLTDAGWSVGIRRFCEHIASLLFPWLAILFLPVALLGKRIYLWMTISPAQNNLVAAKLPIFTVPGFWISSAVFFAVWWILSSQLSRWSLKQDETGAAECTRKMRFYSGWGIVAFSAVLTLSGILWMKSLQYQWFSAMHGVYFFSTCAWAGLATIYVIAAALLRQGTLTAVLQKHYFYFIGVLILGFTLLSAYTEFAQYFVVWNANVPEETFWYLIRENGNWWWLSMLLIVGKFFVPFFILLPVAVKTNFKVLIPTCILIWAMHALDLAFNIFPALHNDGYHFKWIWLPAGCLMLMGGFLAKIFLCKFNSNPPYPKRDPRLLEAMGVSQDTVRDLVAANSGGAK
ncbi:MAG TPA: hypothetical protein VG347_24550 [Verrucomicrobiae bacterium]|nr:hypothetical protein [Verrucomicrobiae bacterium]